MQLNEKEISTPGTILLPDSPWITYGTSGSIGVAYNKLPIYNYVKETPKELPKCENAILCLELE